MLYGAGKPSYERALQSHQRHAERWGHTLKVLREHLAAGSWNKPTYILHVLAQELIKPPSERAEWLMWVDADWIIINPAISSEVFLPPSDLSHIHFIGTRDHIGPNTGIFYLRVSPWSVSFLVETQGMPLYESDLELGRSADQEAMGKTLSKEKGEPIGEGYREGMAYVPRTWINTYEWRHAYEGQRGDMLVHFPGLEEQRWKHMADWLDIVEMTPEKWECPLAETKYWNLRHVFWRDYRVAYELVTETDRMQKEEVFSDAVRAAAGDLKAILETEADDTEKVENAGHLDGKPVA
ncbi:hypothetical protein LTR49_027160 [Elasticomyces elasticus]|nr:hypothetical protein LTR49_027160 [Elasticomyces elasticus]